MLTEERYSKILSILEDKGSVTVLELVDELNISESTIRRDLTTLDSLGRLIKVHGGAISKNGMHSAVEEKFTHKKEINLEAKKKIGKYAASLIRKDDFVYIDAGTTTECIIDNIKTHDATFITNAIGHARLLAERGFKVYVLGGEFKATTEAIVGEEALASLEKYNFTKGFWGTNGINIKQGFTTPDLKEALVKRKSMENCKECYVLADDSKFSKISSVSFASFDKAQIITTKLTQETYKKYKNITNIKWKEKKYDLYTNI